jgi:small conductance mechanosensitive channel
LSGWGGVLVTGLRILVIVIVALVAMRVLQRLIRLFRERITRRMDDPEQVKRAQTLGHVFRYLAAVGVTLVAAIEILHELDVSLAPILGAAGVVGLAVGFGAQSLVKDYFTGFFILLENQLRQGDVVEVGGKSDWWRGDPASCAARLRRQRAPSRTTSSRKRPTWARAMRAGGDVGGLSRGRRRSR